jgi:hypothetical protein
MRYAISLADSSLLGIVSPGEGFRVRLRQRSVPSMAAALDAVKEEAAAPFNLESGPLLRAALLCIREAHSEGPGVGDELEGSIHSSSSAHSPALSSGRPGSGAAVRFLVDAAGEGAPPPLRMFSRSSKTGSARRRGRHGVGGDGGSEGSHLGGGIGSGGVEQGLDAVFVVTLHHSVADEWATGVFFSELSALYACHSHTFTPPELPRLLIQYSDYAAWHRAELAGRRGRAAKARWRERLLGAPPMLQLPYDRKRPPVPDFVGAAVQLELPAELHASLRAGAGAAKVTLNSMLLTAFQVCARRRWGWGGGWGGFRQSWLGGAERWGRGAPRLIAPILESIILSFFYPMQSSMHTHFPWAPMSNPIKA